MRFTCKSCGQTVRVADSFAGKKGRCPFCKKIVPIPLKGESTLHGQKVVQEQRGDELSALAAAVGGEEPVSEYPTRVPGPPAEPEPSLDELKLDEVGQDLSGKTDALPAMTPEPPARQTSKDAQADRPAEPPKAPFPAKTKKLVPWILLVVMGAAIVALATALIVVLSSKQ